MVDVIINALKSITSNTKLLTVLCSMFPLIELKGAIPVGVKLGSTLFESAFYSYVGSSLVSIPVFFLLIPVFNLLKRIGFIKKIVDKIEAMLIAKANAIAEKNNGDSEKEKERFLVRSLLIFVAVPFPVTGVWTGTAIAVFLKIKPQKAIPAIFVGNLIAGSIITLLTFFFKEYVDIIIYALFVIVIIMLIVTITKISKAKPQE